MSGIMEVRVGKRQRVEYRAAADGGLGTIGGYAAVYNSLSQNLGGFVEQISPGAFDNSLRAEVRVLCRYNHDDNYLLGTTTAGTLHLSSDGTGMPYECDLPDTTAGRDTRALAMRGDISHSSFAFSLAMEGGDTWSLTENGFPLRTIDSVAMLYDVAPVNSPAYQDSTAGMRSLSSFTGLPLVALKNAPLEEVRALIERGPSDVAKRAANDAADGNVIAYALGQLAAIDGIVDASQAYIASYLGIANPDCEDDQMDPADMPDGEPMMGRSLSAARLELLRHSL